MNCVAIVICATAMALAGCASAPAQKPVMPDDKYRAFGSAFVGISKCVETGQMTPENGSLGLQFNNAGASTYAYDTARMDSTVRSLSAWAPDASWCSGMAMHILTRKRQIDQGNAAPARFQQEDAALVNANKIKPPVYCHYNGATTVCN